MTDIYTEFQETADELLEEFKQGTVTLTRTIQGTPNPETPWIPAPSETRTYTVKATVGKVLYGYVNGTSILTTDGLAIARTLMDLTAINGVAQSPVTQVRITPLVSDSMTVDERGVTLITVKPQPGAGTPSVWHLIYRG